MSKVDELKKVAARITTANGDLSAVEGVSISEVIEFMADNLNVDSNGALIVSELKAPVVSGGSVAYFDRNSEVFDNSSTFPMYFKNLDSSPVPAVDDGTEYVMRCALNGEEFIVDKLYAKEIKENFLVGGADSFMLTQYLDGNYSHLINHNYANWIGSQPSGLVIQPMIFLEHHHVVGSDHEFTEGGACILMSRYTDEGDVFESFEIISIEKKA